MKFEFEIDKEIYAEAAALISIAIAFLFWGLFNFPFGIGIGILVYAAFALYEKSIVGEDNGSGIKRDQSESDGRNGTDGASDQPEPTEGPSGPVSDNTFKGTGARSNTDPHIVLSRPSPGSGV